MAPNSNEKQGELVGMQSRILCKCNWFVVFVVVSFYYYDSTFRFLWNLSDGSNKSLDDQRKSTGKFGLVFCCCWLIVLILIRMDFTISKSAVRVSLISFELYVCLVFCYLVGFVFCFSLEPFESSSMTPIVFSIRHCLLTLLTDATSLYTFDGIRSSVIFMSIQTRFPSH